MRLKQEKFYKHCNFNGKEYAIECMGEPIEMQGIKYYVNKMMIGNGWVVTVGNTGANIGEVFNSRKQAVETIPKLSEQVQEAVKKYPDIMDVFEKRLKGLKTLNEEQYRELIRKG